MNTTTTTMLLTQQLDVPHRYGGGYMYSDGCYGTLDGERLPTERRGTKERWPGNPGALQALRAAPIGAVYKLRYDGRDADGIAPWDAAYRKVGPQEWELIAL